MPIKEYALYTIANAMLGTLTVLSDGGISSGVMSQSSKVWEDKIKLGIVFSTGMYLRKKFALVSLVISTPILFYLLIHQGAQWYIAILIILSLIPAFYAALSDTLLEIPLKLHQDILPLQKNQVLVATLRIIMIIFTLFIFPFTSLALISNGLPRIWGNIKLLKINSKYIEKTIFVSETVKNEILELVKKLLPSAVYYCFSSQISIWLISFFGNSTFVAQLGALGRLATLLSIFSILFNTLILPRFVKINDNYNLLKKRFYQIQICFLVGCIITSFLVFSFANQLLSILGQDYKNLKVELVLSILASYISIIAGLVFGLCTSKGWILNSYIFILVNISSIIIGINFFNVSTIKGVLYFSIFTSSISYLFVTIFCHHKVQNNFNG